MLSRPSPHRIFEVVRLEVWLVRAEGGRIPGEEETQARRDCCQAAPSGGAGLAGSERGGGDPLDRRDGSGLRDELLNGEIFYTLREAKVVIESWRQHSNSVRPHASLGYRPPAPELFVPAFAAWPPALTRPALPARLPVVKRPTLN
jgi:transposase InsO family protein